MRYTTSLLSACVAALIPVVALASTTIEYESTCRYVDSSKKVKYAGSCHGNFGLTGNQKAPAQYIMTFPNKSEITVILYGHDLATVNGIPAKKQPGPAGGFRFLTGEDENFTFGTPPPGSM